MRVNLESLKYEKTDIFFRLKNRSIKNIKDIFIWANKNGLLTQVTMLDCRKSFSRIESDKEFSAVLNLINNAAKQYFVIILRKKMNLFLILYKNKVIRDILEIGIRGIDIDSKEYFISILMKKKYLEELSKYYAIERIV